MIRRALGALWRRLPGVEGRRRVAALEARLAQLEERTLNRRAAAIDELADYLVGAEVPGDYLEFGVFEGRTLGHAYRAMHVAFPKMRFFGLDSFEGLPEPDGVDREGGYSSGFTKGQFRCTREQVARNLRASGGDLDRIELIEGWFSETLNGETARRHGIDRVAAAWIDVDLYESTLPVLSFIETRLSVGSVLLFDDWRCFRNLPDFGEQRACREWLESRTGLGLRELFSFGWHGLAFTVESLPSSPD